VKKNMLPSSRSRKRQRGATIIMLLIMLPLLLIPVIGLAIDGTRLYIVNSKLSAAVDGAALGAGRLLGTAADPHEIAGEFLQANFPNGYWNTTPVAANIKYLANNPNVQNAQTIAIYATTTLPLTFGRMLGQTGAAVSASSFAVRRVTRVEIVLDRSGSMNTADPINGGTIFTTMQTGAKWFASQFTAGYDEVGLVMFGGTAVVSYPTTHPWVNNPNGAGGPDTAFATNPSNQVGPIFDQLTNMGVGGGTGTPEALSQAYVEIQKAHNRDLAANGIDNANNTIVLFTDGVPDAIAAYINDPNNNSLKPYNKCGGGSKDASCKGIFDTTKSPCTNDPAGGAASTQMRGFIVAGGQPAPKGGGAGWSGTLGLMRLASLDSSQNLTWWEQNNPVDYTPGDPSTSLALCGYLGSNGIQAYSPNYNSGNNETLQDLAIIPTKDLYGNVTNSTAYTNSVMTDGTNTWSPNSQGAVWTDATSAPVNNAIPNGAYNVAAAAWNATDSIGNTIRSYPNPYQIQIITIGYSGNGGTDTGLLTRLANTPASTSFVATQPIGQFFLVNSPADLIPAFAKVASSILRLAF
jgi:Flp pilus assembly protein TadG